MPRGDKHLHGGQRANAGRHITRITLTDSAARALRYQVTHQYTGARYSKEQADAAASAIIEALHNHRLTLVTDEMIAAIYWLEEARRMCFDEAAQRGLDQLIAALWVAKNQQTVDD